MFLRKLRDLLDEALCQARHAADFVKDNKTAVIGSAAGLLIAVLFVFNLKNFYCSLLFFPDKTKTGLLYERRIVLYGHNRVDRINKAVEELLLGPIGPDFVDIFPIKSRLLTSRLEKDVLMLNLSRETVMDVDWETNNDMSIYRLLVQSIVNTVCYHDRGIKSVKLYFDGKEYKYIGDYFQPENGIKPDWKVLKK